jgi:hypothetical protein
VVSGDYMQSGLCGSIRPPPDGGVAAAGGGAPSARLGSGISRTIMVALVIAFPITVTALLDKPHDVDLNKVKIEVPQIDLPPLEFSPTPKQ